jgi:CheY-like chemotaxis protein
LARKILLADDSVTAQNMGRKILADAGYDVITVNNGSAALKRIAEIKPDLIVLDVYMPGYSGLEVCQRLKDAVETAHIPVLLTVGKLEPFKAEEARRVRADAHIVKPFEASELLTTITRLEDRMVPQQSEGGRFSTSVSGVERFSGEGGGRKTESNADADTGWKSRLRFPSKKRKEEPESESEDAAAGATFRDFRKAKDKTGASGAFTVKAPAPPGQEPGLVPDIPRDITPEELDALSALAAKLDGSIPVTENIAPLADEIKTGLAEASPAELAVAQTEPETLAPVVEAAAAVAEAPAVVVEEKSQVEIPVEHAEPVSEVAAVVANPVAGETHLHETEHPEAQHAEAPAAAAVAVNTALLVQEPAPVDRNDEPMFASAASSAQAAGEKIAVKPVEAVAKTEATESTEAGVPAEAVIARNRESKSEELKSGESKAQESQTEELKAEQTAPLVPVAASVLEEAEEPAPSDAELAEALRLLTPATGHADVSTIPSHGTLIAAGQLLAEEAARNAAAAPRWMAEPVALSPEESAISLEAEMFSTFATMPAAKLASASGGEMEPVRIAGVSAIAAAVENRLAEAELAARAQALAATTAAEASTAEAPAEVTAAVSDAASPVVDGIEAKKIEAEQKDSAAKVAEEAPAKEAPAATFADAMGKDEIEAPAEPTGEPFSATTAATAMADQDSNSDAEGEESMGKDAKSKSGKSTWHQMRTAPASAASNSDVVEAAKQAEHAAEEAPKAMAAAAAADGGTASVSATDASTIASIVDSVMADLRPRIVEEIARKLAGK